MREIKFRAWDKENNQWVNQNAVLPNWSDTPYFNVACIVGDETLELRSDENFIWCEYTGLKDKNGKEVFEGDIVRFKLFNEATPCYWEVKIPNIYLAMKNEENHQIEVIGNLYQHPELLVKKN